MEQQSFSKSTRSRNTKNVPDPLRKPTNGSDVLTNGFHGYKEGYEKLEKIGVTRGYNEIINKTVVPISLILTTPNVGMILWFTAEHCKGSYMEMLNVFSGRSILDGLAQIWSTVELDLSFAIGVLLCYSVWALILMKVLPGRIVEGPITPKGNVPKYVDNGFYCYTVTMIGLAGLTFLLKSQGFSPSVIYDRFDQVLISLNLFSLIFCLFLYIKGLYAPSSTDCGSSGSFIFDYYWGTELYPKLFGFDVKVFTNCRFGMTIWGVLVAIFALKSYELHGFVDSMFVSAILQLAYITKFFWWEAGYMRTIDIMVDRAGFYICWGCLVFIPSFYASVSLYLVNNPVNLGPVTSSLILTCGLASIYINYNADWQKQRVRQTNGECLIWGKKPEFLRAKYNLESGQEKESILLTSGWWGIARHFHYVPEIMLTFFWSVPALATGFMPYSYLTFLTILLTHRSFRDDEKCGSKYGDFWAEYCRKVPHRIVPYLF